jgi:hypothetical protein
MSRGNNDKAKWGTQEFTNQLFQYYRKQSDLLQELYKYQFDELKMKPNERVDSLYLLLFSMHDTAESVGILIANQKINEAHMMARALLERIVNYIFLLYCDEEDHKKYLLYTKQKSYRNLKKNIKVGKLIAELKWTGKLSLENDPELQKAINLFTSKRGKTITRWRSKSLPEMLNILYQKTDIDIKPLMLGLLAIYDDASEALHGTLYGTIFQIGIFTRGNLKTKKQIISSVHGQLSMLLLALGACINSLTVAIDKIFPIEAIREKSKENFRALEILDQKTKSQKRMWSVGFDTNPDRGE